MKASNIIETEFEWFLYHLKSRRGAGRSPAQYFQIADTIILRSGSPVVLYYSEADDAIKSIRKKDLLKSANIAKFFSSTAKVSENQDNKN